MSNDELYDAAVDAINKLFGDMSVGLSVTRENLETLRGEIDVLLENLE